MTLQGNSDLIVELVQALADTAPQGWTKFSFYFECLEDEKIGLRNAHTGECFGGENHNARLDDYHLGGSMEVFKTLDVLFRESLTNGDRWCGVLLVVLDDGRFKCQFFYDDTPMLNDNHSAVDKILSSGLMLLN